MTIRFLLQVLASIMIEWLVCTARLALSLALVACSLSALLDAGHWTVLMAYVPVVLLALLLIVDSARADALRIIFLNPKRDDLQV